MNSLVISRLESIGKSDACIVCDLHVTYDFLEYMAHPDFIIFLGQRYSRSGWDSDKKIVYYRGG